MTTPTTTALEKLTEHFMDETKKLLADMPLREPIHAKAYDFVNTYNEYLEEAGDDGDMLLIMVDRIIRECEAQAAADGARRMQEVAATTAGSSPGNNSAASNIRALDAVAICKGE